MDITIGITELALFMLELELTAIRRGRVGVVLMKLRAKGADNELAAIYPAVGKCNNVEFVGFILLRFGLFILLTNDGGTLQFVMGVIYDETVERLCRLIVG